MKPEDEIPVAVATTQEQWRRQRIAKDQVQVAQAGEVLGTGGGGLPGEGERMEARPEIPFQKELWIGEKK